MLYSNNINANLHYLIMDYLSSPMQWCESKTKLFYYSIYIVEFENAISSLSFCLFALYGYYMHRKLVSNPELWIVMGLIGITSCWFHATMSSAGQFADEMSIVIMMFYCTSVFYKKYIIKQTITSSNLNLLLFNFACICLMFGTIYVCWAYQSYSPFILLTEGAIFITPIICYNKYIDNQVYKNCITSIKITILAIAFWIIDFTCYFNAHQFWHIIMGYGIYVFSLNVVIFKERLINNALKINFVNAAIPYWAVVQNN